MFKWLGNLTGADDLMATREEQAVKQEQVHDPKLLELIDASPELAVAVAKYLLLTRRLSRWRTRQVNKNGMLNYYSSIQESLDDNSRHQSRVDEVIAITDPGQCAAALTAYVAEATAELEQALINETKAEEERDDSD